MVRKEQREFRNFSIYVSFILGQSKCFEGSFREAIWPFLIIGQLFGVMPVVGVRSRPTDTFQFKWVTVRTIYSLSIAAVLALASLLLVWQAFIRKLEFRSIGLLLANKFLH